MSSLWQKIFTASELKAHSHLQLIERKVDKVNRKHQRSEKPNKKTKNKAIRFRKEFISNRNKIGRKRAVVLAD